MRALLVAAAIAAAACGTTLSETNATGNGTSSAAVSSSAAPPLSPSASPTPSPTPQPDPTAGPATYVSIGLGYRVDLPSGWRRSACGTPLAVIQPTGNESFTPLAVGEESGSDMGPHQEEVTVQVEAAGATGAKDQLALYGSMTDRVEAATLDGRAAFRLVRPDSGMLIGYALVANGRTYVIYRPYARNRGPNEYDAAANALMASFHVLSDAEQIAARTAFVTPSAAPPRSADEVVRTIARGFAQTDTAALASVAAPCLVHAIEQAGPYWTTSTKMLADLQQRFSRGAVIAVGTKIEQGPYATYVKATWEDPGDLDRTHKDVQIWIEQRGGTWYWTGWMDLQPQR